MTKSTLVLICTFLNPTTEHNFLSALGFSFLLNIHSIRAQGSSYPSFICQFNNLLKIDRSFFLIEFNISFVFTWELILKIADSTIVYESLDCTVSLGARMWKSLSRFIRHACSWCEQQRQLSICTSYDSRLARKHWAAEFSNTKVCRDWLTFGCSLSKNYSFWH